MARNKCGRQSFRLQNRPVIQSWASVAGKKESEGPLGHLFDLTSQDAYFGQKTWELAEKQLQKLAGYAIVECSSGKHKGESHISYRGRKRLRYVLYEAAISLIARNEEFKEVHRYYRTGSVTNFV